MRNLRISFVIAGLAMLNLQFKAQSTSANNIGLAGKFLGYSNNFVLPFQTNGFTRMILDNGGAGQAFGRLSLGNSLPTGFVPQDRLHLHQIGLFAINNYIRFTNNFTTAGPNDGFAVGNTSSIGGPFGEARLDQYETAPILMRAPNAHSAQTLPYEWFRLQNGQLFQPAPAILPRSTDGYIGLNKNNPRAHIEMVTPAFGGGEEFFMAKPDDILNPANPTQLAPNVQMGLMNLSSVAGAFLPGFFGNINQTAQSGPALQMLGCIPNNHDVFNREPIMRFVVGRDWVINGNIPTPTGGPNIQAIANRPIFSWQNADLIYMYMASNGRARIGFNISAGILPNIPENRVNNRFEITANANDPYYNAAGNQLPTGNPNWGGSFAGSSSGLRFTFLTSNDLVIVPNAVNQIDPGKVLTTDRNGDVVMINTIGNANNGLSVVNGTLIQFGVNCPATPAQVTASQLLNNRQIPMNGFNTVWAGATGSVGIGLPINACVPNNRLEVNNNTGPNPLSGLRLTDLAGAAPLPSNNQALSVNANGDVILTSAPTSTTFGNLCTAANSNALTGNFQVPLGTFHYKFTGQGVITNAVKQDIVSVGYNCVQQAPYRFSVLENQAAQPVPDPTYAGHFKNDNISLLTSALNITGGVFGEARGLLPGPTANSPINVGGVFEGFGSWSNIGVIGRMNPLAVPSNFGPSRYNIGVAGISDLLVNNAALPPAPNYGVFAYAMNSQVLNYGVYTEVPASSGSALSYALYAKAPSTGVDLAGYFDGDVIRTGTDNFSSDQILKQNFDSIPNALGIINQLQPKTFDFKLTTYPQMSLPSGLQYGLVAQDVQPILPAIVNSATHPETTIGNTTYPAFTYSTVEYTQLIPVLVRAVQQLSAQNHKLDSLVTALTQTVSACCSNSSAKQTGINGNDPKELAQINVTLTDEDVIVLDQNKPNPFAEQTTITYNVPEKYGYAQLVFKTVDGRILKTVDVTKKGRGQVNVFANDLSNGLYMYSLIVDGVTVDTKKMIKQN